MMKVLILGGTKFIGLHLCTALAKSGHQLTCFHRTPFEENNVRHITGDRLNGKDMKCLFSTDYDLVIDISGTEKAMMELSVPYARKSCEKYVYISSSSVYDKNVPGPYRETAPLNTSSTDRYISSKIYGEEIVRDCFSDFLIIRTSKVYGPDNYYFSEKEYAEMIRSGNKMPMVGDPLLHFTFIEDLITGIIALIDKKSKGIFNVAGAEPVNLSKFIDTVGSLIGMSPVYDFIDKNILENSNMPFAFVKFSDLMDCELDISKIKGECGWIPQVKIEEGLKTVFAY